MNLNKYESTFKDYAPIVLRIGIALVFLWFSISQFISPKDWAGFLPGFLFNSPNPSLFIYMNATLELVFGMLLLLGIWTRISALILGLHLIGIISVVGYNAIGVRDFGLMLAAFSIMLHGPDKLCIKKGFF